METELRLDGAVNLADLFVEDHLVKLRDHLPRPKLTQTALPSCPEGQSECSRAISAKSAPSSINAFRSLQASSESTKICRALAWGMSRSLILNGLMVQQTTISLPARQRDAKGAMRQPPDDRISFCERRVRQRLVVRRQS